MTCVQKLTLTIVKFDRYIYPMFTPKSISTDSKACSKTTPGCLLDLTYDHFGHMNHRHMILLDED